MNDWTDEQIETLKRMHAAGHKFVHIGLRLGLSKNQIVGKARRLGLEQRRKGSGGRPRVHAVELPQAEPAVEVTEVIEVPVPDAEDIAAAAEPFVPRLKSTSLSVRASCCQWPIGDFGEPGFRFCGKEDVVSGKPYCPEHTKIAYVPIRPYVRHYPQE